LLNFDADVNSVEDFLADLDEEVDLLAPKWRFKQQVNELMKAHPRLLREDAEQVVENVIRTKCTDKRCACGAVADLFDPNNRSQIYCGRCWYARTGSYHT